MEAPTNGDPFPTSSPSDTKISISAENITTLTRSLSTRALILDPTHAQYDIYRKGWNHGFWSLRPALICVAACTSDVVKILKWCQLHSYPMTIASGKHSRYGSKDNAVQLNLEHMRSVHVNVRQQTVTAQGGARNGDIDIETLSYDLATTLGSVASTGMGLVLGGGAGYLVRKQGFASDAVIAAQIVTANGEVLDCDAEHNKELFWAIKGAGHYFGVVTQLTFKLSPVGHRMRSVISNQDQDIIRKYNINSDNEFLHGKIVRFTKVFPGVILPAMLVAWSQLSYDKDYVIDENVWMELLVVNTPMGPGLVVVTGYTGADIFAGHRICEDIMRRLTSTIPREIPTLQENVEMVTYGVQQQFVGEKAPPGYWLERSGIFDEFTPELAELLLQLYSTRPAVAVNTTMHIILWGARGFGQTSVDPESSALSPQQRASSFWLVVISNYDGLEQNLESVNELSSWQDLLKQKTKPYVTAFSPNVLGEEGDSAKNIYQNHLTRLQKLKQQFDPENFFRFNHARLKM